MPSLWLQQHEQHFLAGGEFGGIAYGSGAHEAGASWEPDYHPGVESRGLSGRWGGGGGVAEPGGAQMNVNTQRPQSVPTRTHCRVHVQVRTVLAEAQPLVLFSRVEIHGGVLPQAS